MTKNPSIQKNNPMFCCVFRILSIVSVMFMICGCAKYEISGNDVKIPDPEFTVKSLKVGAAKVDITPDLLSRKVILASSKGAKEATDLLDPLYIRAIIIQSGNKKLGFVSFEQLCVTSKMYGAVSARVKNLGLSSLVLQATHTQNGEGQFVQDLIVERTKTGRFRAAAFEKRLIAAETALRIADQTLQDAFMVHESTKAALEFDDKIIPYNKLVSSESAADTKIERVMFFSKEQKSLILQMIFFSVFPQILDDENSKISGDLPGRLSKLAETDFPHTIAIACPGTIADVMYNAEFVNIFRNNRTDEEILEIFTKRLYNCFYTRKMLNQKIDEGKNWQYIEHIGEEISVEFADDVGIFEIKSVLNSNADENMQLIAFGKLVFFSSPFHVKNSQQVRFRNHAENVSFHHAWALSCCNCMKQNNFSEKIMNEVRKILAQLPKPNK